MPSPRGPLPGNGSLVAALRHATGVVPVATGKPDPTMHRESVERSGAQAPLVVGDRLDTDIEGARAVGCASLLVLTGVTTPADLLAARPDHRPDYVARDLRGLLVARTRRRRRTDGGLPVRSVAGVGGRAGGYRPSARRRVRRCGDADLQALRALCAASWAADGRPVPQLSDAGDDASAADADRLGLVATRQAPVDG